VYYLLKKYVRCFINVISKQGLDTKLIGNGCYILNTASEHEEFGHFIVLILNVIRGTLTVWDSLGQKYDFLDNLPYNVIYESQYPVQSRYSTLCGLYVIYCLVCISRNKSFRYINDRFSRSNTDMNDRNLYIWFIHNDIIPRSMLPTFTNSRLLDIEIQKICL
jgi:hypothetical protein